MFLMANDFPLCGSNLNGNANKYLTIYKLNILYKNIITIKFENKIDV